MNRLKRFESFNYDKEWEEVINHLDVYQLFELLLFKYGRGKLKDTEEALKEEEDSDYNPDHIYDIIRYELEQLGLFNNFVSNYENYLIDFQENDPTHWRYRNKNRHNHGLNW